MLALLDGLGVPQNGSSTVFRAHRPNFELLEKYFPMATLQASGIAVGLPWGEEGNSEVGHITIGAGRPIFHYLPRIMLAIQDGSFFRNEAILEGINHVRKNNSRLHLLGLFSSGSVHSYAEHLYALLDLAKKEGIRKVYLHLFTDGRDASATEGAKFLEDLEFRIHENYPFAKIASISGRYFSMDRDEHWDRIERVYNLLANGKGKQFKLASSYVSSEYAAGRTDEFVEPGFYALDGSDIASGRIEKGDSVIFFNFREDSVRELTRAFTEESFDKFPREKILDFVFVTMTEYEKGLPVRVAFTPLDISWPIARVISEAGLKQLHIAETEKYAHVTYFFNGGYEKPFSGESRILVQSLSGAHFDEHPEMSSREITNDVLKKLGEYDFILFNLANADMVGHSGNFDATVRAIEVLDESIGRIFKAVLEIGGVMLVTGDHGNAEEKLYMVTGEKKTKHSINPVPLYLVAEDFRGTRARSNEEIVELYNKSSGILTDIAPTILELMGLPKPAEMTGVSLLPKLVGKIVPRARKWYDIF